MIHASDEVPTLEEARERFSSDLEGMPHKAVALAILDFVESNGEADFTFAQAHEAAGAKPIDGVVLATISLLASSRGAPLETRFVLVDDAGAEHVLGGAAFDLADRTGVLDHPVTGQRIPDPLKRIFPRLAPRPGLLPAGPAPGA